MSAHRRWGARAIASLIVFVIATLLTPVAIVGHWGHRTVMDAEAYIATVGPLIEQPAVQESLGNAISSAVIEQVDTRDLVDQFLGGLIDNEAIVTMLGAPITAGINNLIGEATQQIIASDAFKNAWYTTNELAQASLVKLLEGNPEGVVQVKGEDIVLDLTNLLTTLQKQLVDRGFTAAGNITIPDTDRQFVLASSAALPQLQFIYQLSSPILQWFPLLLAALFGLAMALARNRSRTVLATGIALIAMTVVTRLGLDAAEVTFVDQLRGTVFEPASTVFWNTFFTYLVAGLDAVIALGIILIVAGWFAGRSQWATRARTEIGSGLHEIGAVVPSNTRRAIRAYTPVLRWAVVIVLALLLVFEQRITVSNVLWISALGALLFTVIEFLSGPDREDAVEAVVIIEEISEA